MWIIILLLIVGILILVFHNINVGCGEKESYMYGGYSFGFPTWSEMNQRCYHVDKGIKCLADFYKRGNMCCPRRRYFPPFNPFFFDPYNYNPFMMPPY